MMEIDLKQTSFCKKCEEIGKTIAHNPDRVTEGKETVYLGTFKQIRRRASCPGCQSIIACFRGREWSSMVFFHSYMFVGGGVAIGDWGFMERLAMGPFSPLSGS